VTAPAATAARDREGVPARRAVVERVVPETDDSSTFWTRWRGADGDGYRFAPGQFNMLYRFGVGEVPISISSDPSHPDHIAHTIRFVGRVTDTFRTLSAGDVLGVRGPFGSSWPLDRAVGRDLVIVAGGLGICPVRPAVEHALRHRERFDRVVLLLGARTPASFPYGDELRGWVARSRDLGVEIDLTVDEADDGWAYRTGVVTTLFGDADLRPARSTAFVCGPEVMMRFACRALVERGFDERDVHLSMERNMQCAIGICGHCQVGPLFVCRDGPVLPYARVRPLLEVTAL
jgi:NAD(P)H-flavin reductase